MIDLAREIRQCGRPTKAKTPCKQQTADFFTPGCRIHCTEEELALGQFISKVYRDARREGHEEGKQASEERIERLKEKVKRYEKAELERLTRTSTPSGHQIVQVDGYAYQWDKQKTPLKVGDKVWIPTTWVDRAQGSENYQKLGTVTALGTTYDGELRSVLSRSS